MELLAAFIGAMIGAVVSYALTKYSRNKEEKGKAITAVRTEVKLNLEVAKKVLKANSWIAPYARGKGERKWCEIIPFSDSAWNSILSSGQFSHFKSNVIEALFQTYAEVEKANFVAMKIQAGRFDLREAEAYNKRVKDAKNSSSKVLKLLEPKPESSSAEKARRSDDSKKTNRGGREKI